MSGPDRAITAGAEALARYDRDVTGLNPRGEPTNGDLEAARAVIEAAYPFLLRELADELAAKLRERCFPARVTWQDAADFIKREAVR